jgi:hypothetical protein
MNESPAMETHTTKYIGDRGTTSSGPLAKQTARVHRYGLKYGRSLNVLTNSGRSVTD